MHDTGTLSTGSTATTRRYRRAFAGAAHRSTFRWSRKGGRSAFDWNVTNHASRRPPRYLTMRLVSAALKDDVVLYAPGPGASAISASPSTIESPTRLLRCDRPPALRGEGGAAASVVAPLAAAAPSQRCGRGAVVDGERGRAVGAEERAGSSEERAGSSEERAGGERLRSR